MVCMGNICRSPMAQGIMEKKVKEYDLNFMVDSAGTIDYHEGEPPDNRAQAIMIAHGIDISRQRARQIRLQDLDSFDHIFVMDLTNYNDLLQIADPEQRDKIKLITDYAWPGKQVEVPDPYYGGREGFQNTFNLLNTACDAIAHHLAEESF